MMTTLVAQLGIIPTLLIVLVGMLVLYTEPDHKAGRRFLLFLVVTAALLAAGVIVATLLGVLLSSRAAHLITQQLAPALTGTLALLLLRLKWPARLGGGGKALVILLGVVLFVACTWGERYVAAYAVVPNALLLAALWILVDRSDALAVSLSLASLISSALLFRILSYTEHGARFPDWLRVPFAIWFIVLPELLVALAAALIAAALRPRAHSQTARPPAARAPWFPVAWRLGLAVLLIGALAYTVLWASIWDQTSDGLGGLFLSQQAASVAVAAGVVMGLTLTGWRRSAGLAFAVLVPLVMFGAFDYGWDVSYHELTEARAARIERAVERFYARIDRYPEELRELVPRDLLWVPGPVIVQGYGWCYQGGEDRYWLGTFYREYWGFPFSLRTYASAGSTPESEWPCTEELAELKARRDPPPMDERAAAPTKVPLPTSVVSVPRTPVQPLVRARSTILGTWSGDGRYLVFTVRDAPVRSPSTLSFLDAETVTVCHTEGQVPWTSSLRRQIAWLPDGRLLFLSEEGELDLLTPCQAGAERLTDRYPVGFDHVEAYDGESGRILLRSEDAFWILDSDSLEAHEVPEVSPNPYELHWDDAAWSPGGARLAISRLNGRDRKAGSTLYLVAGDTRRVVKSLPMEYATDQHAPGVEWLTKEELLLHSQGLLAILDLSSDPPTVVNVLTDIFDLDIDYPDEISSMATIVHPDDGSYHLAVGVNHPRNQDLYLYHAETGSVQVLRHDVHTILLFPDGEWEELAKREDATTYQDQYEVVWVDTHRDPQRLTAQGHIPRDYPHLFVRYLPQSSQLVCSSSQGVSLVSVPDGELLGFWELVEANGSIHAYPTPDGEALVARVEGTGLYWIHVR